MQGSVEKLFYFKNKKYGFIRGGDENSYYFDINAVNFDVRLGDCVLFDGGRNEKGLIATNVSLV